MKLGAGLLLSLWLSLAARPPSLLQSAGTSAVALGVILREGLQRLCDRRSYTCVQQQGLCLQEGFLLSGCFSRITWCYSELRCCSSTAAEQKPEVP